MFYFSSYTDCCYSSNCSSYTSCALLRLCLQKKETEEEKDDGVCSKNKNPRLAELLAFAIKHSIRTHVNLHSGFKAVMFYSSFSSFGSVVSFSFWCFGVTK